MALLIQFLLRLSFGLATGMAITSPKLVTSGYFRNHLYVTLGLSSLAALLSHSVVPEAFWFCVGAAVASYVGSVCWLYEKSNAGRIALAIVALASIVGAINQHSASLEYKDDQVFEKYFPSSEITGSISAAEASEILERSENLGYYAGSLDPVVSSGLLLGLTMASMLLGHWYLNSPTMDLKPLRRLILAMGAATVLQMVLSGLGLWGELAYAQTHASQWILFVILRWTFGLLGVGVLAWMAWQTLKIPNTQSATGILYVAVIGTFVGETMALLLSAESMFPL